MGRFGQGNQRRGGGGGGGGSGGSGGNWGNKKGKGFISSGGGGGYGSSGGRYGRSSGTDSYYTQDNYGGGYGMGYSNMSSSMMSGGYGSNQVGQLHEQLRMQESQLAMTSNLLQQQTQLLAEVGMRVGMGGGGRYDRKRSARDYGGYGYDSKRLRRDSGPYGGYRSDSRNMGRQRGRDNRGNDRSKAAGSKGKFTSPIADHNKATTYCHVCELETYARKMFDAHLEDAKHKERMANLEADPEDEANKVLLEKMANIEDLKAALTEECKICDISYAATGRDHERSDRHNFCKEQVEKGCGWCELTKFDDASHVLQHRNSREHIENMIKKGRKISGTRIEKRINDEGKEVKVIIDDSVVEVDKSVTYCFACDEEMATLELINEHFETDKHKEKLAELEEKADDENVKEVLKHIARQEELKIEQSEFCSVCDIPYSGTEDDHVRETLHKYRGQQSARGCTWCDISEFGTYTEVLRHRSTEEHKEKEKENNVKTGRERTVKVTAEKVEIPLFSKGKTYGEDEMMPILGYYCKVCKKYYRKRYDTLKFHCSSENHYRNWKKIKEDLVESTAQFEEIQDAIVKTTRIEMGEIDQDAGAEDMETTQDEHQNGAEGGDGVVAEFAEDELLQDAESGDHEAGTEEMEAENSILSEEAEETSPSKAKGTARRGKARRGRK